MIYKVCILIFHVTKAQVKWFPYCIIKTELKLLYQKAANHCCYVIFVSRTAIYNGPAETTTHIASKF